MEKKLTVSQNRRAIGMLPDCWEIRSRKNMRDGDGNIEAWADKAFYVLDGRTDVAGCGDSIVEAIADALGAYPPAIRAYAVSREFTHAQVLKLADDALNVMCKFVQDSIGQTDGGIAGMFWDNHKMRGIIVDYVITEIQNRD